MAKPWCGIRTFSTRFVSESLHVNAEIESVALPELLEAEAALAEILAKTEAILGAVAQEEARETAEAARAEAEEDREDAEEARAAEFAAMKQEVASGELRGRDLHSERERGRHIVLDER